MWPPLRNFLIPVFVAMISIELSKTSTSTRGKSCEFSKIQYRPPYPTSNWSKNKRKIFKGWYSCCDVMCLHGYCCAERFLVHCFGACSITEQLFAFLSYGQQFTSYYSLSSNLNGNCVAVAHMIVRLINWQQMKIASLNRIFFLFKKWGR